MSKVRYSRKQILEQLGPLLTEWQAIDVALEQAIDEGRLLDEACLFQSTIFVEVLEKRLRKRKYIDLNSTILMAQTQMSYARELLDKGTLQ